MIIRTFLATAALVALSVGGAAAQQQGKAVLKNTDGATIGSIELTELPGGVLVKLVAKDLPEGEHAFHVHQTGSCEPPAFTSAGGHFNPGEKKHGLMVHEGHHAGDMPNIIVPASGEVALEVVNAAVTLEQGAPNSLYKPEGTAFVVHAGPDDHQSDPTGNAGGRIACAVVE